MLERRLPNRWIGISQRAMLINLILKNVGIDGAGTHAILLRQAANFSYAFEAFRKIPQYVQRNPRANTREPMHFTRVAEFFFSIGGRRQLQELPESRARVRKAPG